MDRQSHQPAAILVIDADPLMLTAVSAMLSLSGYDCHGARDAEAALKAARSLPLDLIVCDLELPGADGWELCRELRGVAGGDELPLIVVARDPPDDIGHRTRDAGGIYDLRKPYDPELLLELVDKTLWVPHLVGTRLQSHVTHPGHQPAGTGPHAVFAVAPADAKEPNS